MQRKMRRERERAGGRDVEGRMGEGMGEWGVREGMRVDGGWERGMER